MKTIKAERITKDNFAPYGRYYNVFEERKTESEDFTAYMLRELHTDEPMNFGITICKAGDFDSISMERHFLTEEPQFCGDGDMVLTVADSDPENAPKAGDVKAFILKPGDLAVLAKGIWHDAELTRTPCIISWPPTKRRIQGKPNGSRSALNRYMFSYTKEAPYENKSSSGKQHEF